MPRKDREKIVERDIKEWKIYQKKVTEEHRKLFDKDYKEKEVKGGEEG